MKLVDGILILLFLLMQNVLSTCPSGIGDIIGLNPFTSCTFRPTLTDEEAIAYANSGEPAACIADKQACVKATKFNKCKNTTQGVINFILTPEVAQSSEAGQCTTLFKGFTQFCDRPFGEFISVFCPDPLPIPIPVMAAIAIGGAAFLVFTCYVCWKTRKAVLLEVEIERAVMLDNILPAGQLLASNNPKVSMALLKISRMEGVEWSDASGGWDAIYKTPNLREYLGTFKTQEEAAEKVQQRKTELDMAATSPPKYLFNPPPLKAPSLKNSVNHPRSSSSRPGVPYDPDRERHIEDLINFYRYYDGDRPDIETHVQNLFDKYGFRGIARALLRKYGVLPAGWSNEYDAGRSIAVSMAAKIFAPGNSLSSQASQRYVDTTSQGIGNSRQVRTDTVPNF